MTKPSLILKAVIPIFRIGKFADVKPVSIWAFGPIFPDILKSKTIDSHVVKNTIEYHSHVPCVDLFYQFQHQFIGTGPLPGGGVMGYLCGDDSFVASRVRTKVGIDMVIGRAIILVQ